MKKISVGYDDQNDVLYIRLADMQNSYGDEEPDDFVTFRDIDTEEVTGYQVMFFRDNVKKVMDFPFEGFDVKDDLVPKLKNEPGCEFIENYI